MATARKRAFYSVKAFWAFPYLPLSRPARHYPRVRIWRSSSERQRDFNPPDQRAAQRTLCRWATPFRRARGTYSSSPSPTDPPLTRCEWLQGPSVLACPEGAQFPCMPGLYDSAEPVTHLRKVARHSVARSEEHTSELQSRQYLVCRLLLEKKN